MRRLVVHVYEDGEEPERTEPKVKVKEGVLEERLSELAMHNRALTEMLHAVIISVGGRVRLTDKAAILTSAPDYVGVLRKGRDEEGYAYFEVVLTEKEKKQL